MAYIAAPLWSDRFRDVENAIFIVGRKTLPSDWPLLPLQLRGQIEPFFRRVDRIKTLETDVVERPDKLPVRQEPEVPLQIDLLPKLFETFDNRLHLIVVGRAGESLLERDLRRVGV